MNIIYDPVNLQLFAEAGTLVNATTGYVNAYDGSSQGFDGTHSLSGEMKTFYDTELLENARVEMYYAQFGKKQKLPANRGTNVEWRRWNTFEKAGKLQEGVIPTGQRISMITKSGTISQYGTYASVSDKLELRAYDDVIMGATEEMGASAAETQETLIRDALLVNTNVLYCDNVDLETGKVIGATPTSCAEMECSDTVMAFLSPDTVAKAATILKKNRVPKINGKYYAVIHPSAAYDLRKSKGWLDVHQYSATSEIFNGEIGELHGVRFIENTFAPILKGEYVNKAGGATYATYFFGKDPFGIIDPEGGALEMIVKPKEVAGGPLNQFSTVGYKFETNGATVLYTERVLRVMSCSSFSATDEPN